MKEYESIFGAFDSILSLTCSNIYILDGIAPEFLCIFIYK